MTHLAELSGRDHLARQAHGRDEAVVERAHVLDPGGGDLLPDLVALGGVSSERLLAHDVLARASSGDRRLGMERVRAAVVEQPDALVGDEIAPVGGGVVPAVPDCRLPDRLLVATRDPDQQRLERRGPRDVRDLPERVRVRLPHEGVAEHPNTDLRHFAIVRTWLHR